jgi:hypothetical protein
MNHIFFGYPGNKRNEYKEIKDKLNFDNITNIIEPFCGTAAISFNIWLEYGDKFSYHLNDKYKFLTDYYDMVKITEPDDIYNNINDVKKSITSDKMFLELHKNRGNNIFVDITIKKMSGFRCGYRSKAGVEFQNDKKFNYFSPIQLKFLEFIKCPYVHITNNNWFDIFDIYKNDEHSLFIFDPPYIGKDNTYYKNPTYDVYEYCKINNNNIFNSTIIFMLEDIPIIRELFINNNIYEPYDKKYTCISLAKNKQPTKHIIISN